MSHAQEGEKGYTFCARELSVNLEKADRVIALYGLRPAIQSMRVSLAVRARTLTRQRWWATLLVTR